MKEMNAYLIFDGNCREALKFYARCKGGDLHLSTFAEAPGDFPPEAQDRIMHARRQKARR